MSNDEELQKNIEAGNRLAYDDPDAKAYQEIFARLNKEPEAYLPLDFADKVIVRIREQQQRSASRDYYWLIVGVLLLSIAMIVAVVLTGFQPGLGFLKGMSAYVGLFAFGAAFILFLNRLDKKILLKAGVDQS